MHPIDHSKLNVPATSDVGLNDIVAMFFMLQHQHSGVLRYETFMVCQNRAAA